MGVVLEYNRTDYTKMNAIDNKYSTSPDDCGCCSATNDNGWQIDLGKMYLIQEIKIYERTDATIIRYIKNEKNDSGLMMICEIKVFDKTCNPGYFGNSCLYEGHCIAEYDMATGACLSCQQGWTGAACNRKGEVEGNIAEHKSTSQFYAEHPNYKDFWNASNGVDGINNCNAVNGTYFTLSSYSLHPWWQVDLGKVYNIQRIKVFGRKGGEEDIQLQGFKVHLSETESALNNSDNVVVYNSSVYPSDGIFDIPVTARKARFCRLQIDATSDLIRPIVICEVEIYGTDNHTTYSHVTDFGMRATRAPTRVDIRSNIGSVTSCTGATRFLANTMFDLSPDVKLKTASKATVLASTKTCGVKMF
ncbi:hypothetical protein MAR_022956 [Mya arenaria]|uniref:Uncharacterized protein n=1 Tax=Mya arenaria TaxID=6604 RepID=A0ABY7DN86_MYAAR|nr:hypothetical protein MAR_022956 [Mya arenaria]